MTQNEVINYWLKSAKEDLKTAQDLFGLKRYSYSLFFAHLTLEKVLKALVVKTTDQAPPWTHDLVKLAKLTKISLSKEKIADLQEINTFNIAARYNDVKFRFYKKATKAYAKKYLERCLKICQWLKAKI